LRSPFNRPQTSDPCRSGCAIFVIALIAEIIASKIGDSTLALLPPSHGNTRSWFCPPACTKPKVHRIGRVRDIDVVQGNQIDALNRAFVFARPEVAH